MNILSIASVLPVPELYDENDIVFTFYEHYEKQFTHDHIYFFRPSPSSFIRGLFVKKWRQRNAVSRLKQYNFKHFEVSTLPYFSISRPVWLHALLSYTIIFGNTNKIKRLIKDKKIHLSHAQYIFPDGLLAYYLFKQYNIPYILTIRSEQKYFRNIISSYLSKKILKHAQYITTPSGPMHDTLKNHHINAELIPHGLGENYFVKKTKNENNKLKLISIGQLIPRKMYHHLIEAITPLVKKYGVSLTIIGEGAEKQKLIQLTEQRSIGENVIFRGKIPHKQIPEILKEHDLFVLTSSNETFGRVYFEAMAAGLPVILSKNTGVYGFIDENESALSVDPFDVNDIRNKIEFLILNPDIRNKISSGGRKVVEKFRWDKICHIFHEKYREAIID
jgi:glycosyltransferase involved in cell wall biosynthesis